MICIRRYAINRVSTNTNQFIYKGTLILNVVPISKCESNTNTFPLW